MNGILYGVGVGPGDPKLMTCLAVETIEKCPVIAVPACGRDHAVSYRIAKGMIRRLDEKECLNLSTPMTKDEKILKESYARAGEQIMEHLDAGRDVAYLTLGDPTIYSTYIYIHRIIRDHGYDAVMINGVPSFCAAAAKLGDSLADRAQQIHIIPSAYEMGDALDCKGARVLMKAASRLPEIKGILRERGLEAVMVENCGLEGECVYPAIDQMPDDASYYSIILVKEGKPW